jgi:predicted N-formylglutamate amidohydrolase
MAQALGAPLFASRTTRLLVDLNRSIGHPALFSRLSARAPTTVKTAILERHYFPFRDEVEAFMGSAVAEGLRVVHISSHSFTPVLNGRVRNADLGLLYDPRRGGERLLCRNWQRAIRGRDSPSHLKVRLNYPYRGTADGFTVHLRRRFHEDSYLGIELEINQQHTQPPRHWTALRQRIVAALLASSHLPMT